MRKVLFSSIIGNVVEWYEFALYAHFAFIISGRFFAEGNELFASISTWGIFAAGSIMRPVGALVFGYIGDKYGRRLALTVSIILMSVPTGLIALIPSYKEIGIWAPILLTLVRLCQGISLGGEFSGAISFSVEHAKAEKKGFVGSTTMFSMCIGILLGSFVTFLLSLIFSPEEVKLFAWKYPFLMGFLLGAFGIYVRTGLHESDEYLNSKAEDAKAILKNIKKQTPFKQLITSSRGNLFVGIGLYMTVTIPFYFTIFFLKEFLYKYNNVPLETASGIATSVVIVTTILLPIFGLLSDKFGTKFIAKYSAIAVIILAFPGFYLIKTGYYMLGSMIFAILCGAYMAPIPTMLVYLFPAKIRYTGVALSYNLAAAIFGGTTPMVFSFILQKLQIWYLLPLYIILAAFISTWAIIKYKKA